MYGPDVAILFTYGSYDMRHTGFPQVDGGQQNPQELGRHNKKYGQLLEEVEKTVRIVSDLWNITISNI